MVWMMVLFTGTMTPETKIDKVEHFQMACTRRNCLISVITLLWEANLNFQISWKIWKQAASYDPSSNRYNLSMEKKKDFVDMIWLP